MQKSVKKITVCADGRRIAGIRLSLSRQVGAALRIVRRHFRILTSDTSLSFESSRYDGWWDYAAVAVRTSYRLETYMGIGGSCQAGSGYLADRPWYSFGPDDTDERADYKFQQYCELLDHYDESIKDNYKTDYDIPYQDDPTILIQMAIRNGVRTDVMFAASILFLKDLIWHSGPDSDMFFDLFTNDSRDNPDTVDLDAWEQNRCKLFGRFGAIKSRTSTYSHDYSTGYCYSPPKPVKRTLKKCDPELNLISSNMPLFENTPVHRMEFK